jgi:hypothetical protein
MRAARAELEERRERRALNRVVRLRDADEEVRRLSVRKDLRYICKYYFKGTDGKPYRLQDYHIEILEAMFVGGQLVVNVPTDHMKSSLGCFLFPILSLMDNPDETHLICGANVNDSRRRVQAIERELETNEALIRDFPWVAKPDGRVERVWSTTQMIVAGRTINKPNPSILAAAIGSNDLKGRRGKLLMDDVEGIEARTSPVKREQLYSWLKFEAWRCFEDRMESERPLLCLLGTPFDVDSIYFRMESQGWKTIRYPCYRDGGLDPPTKIDAAGKPWVNPPREYLWPEKKEKVEKARKTLRRLEFATAYLMDPTGGDPSRISADEIRRRMSEAPPVEGESAGYVVLDPAAGGIGPRLDYAGLAVCRIRWPQGDELPEVEVLEAHAFTQGLFEQVHFCSELSERYGYPVIFEINAQQGGTYQQTFMHLHPEVKLIRHFTSHNNKFDDAMGLTVIKRLVEERQLYVMQEQLETDGIQSLIQEIRDLQPPFKLHNHISMALWFAVRYVYERVRHYKAPPIKLTYALNPMANGAAAWNYEDDPSLPPLERAYRAIGYDRTARSGTPQVLGYTAWSQRRQMPWDKAIAEEEERFSQAVRKKRTG